LEAGREQNLPAPGESFGVPPNNQTLWDLWDLAPCMEFHKYKGFARHGVYAFFLSSTTPCSLLSRGPCTASPHTCQMLHTYRLWPLPPGSLQFLLGPCPVVGILCVIVGCLLNKDTCLVSSLQAPYTALLLSVICSP
jgi:hypothetical protein